MIIDYGVGNIASIVNMINKVGGQACVCKSPHELKNAQKIILPGVGAFDHGMQLLIDNNWIAELNDAVLNRKVPILGICLGMQLMCRSSEEGELNGLGWIDAEVIRFKHAAGSAFKIPHMGWSTIEIVKSNSIIRESSEQERFYFVHSYHVDCKVKENVVAVADHGYKFTASFSSNNIFGTQFHPEKSHRFGMKLMENFVEMSC